LPSFSLESIGDIVTTNLVSLEDRKDLLSFRLATDMIEHFRQLLTLPDELR